MKPTNRAPDPTPNEIRQRCMEVQDTWKPSQEWARAGRPNRDWTAPKTTIGELAGIMEEWTADSTEDV